MEKTYTSLHNHTEFSNLKIIDSINRVPELLDYGYQLGLGGVAITDHDCVSGHLQALNYYNEHFDEEQKKKFKLILGNEIYLCREGLNAENHQKGERFYHLILLAKDDIGLRQIRQISARAWTRGYVKNIMNVRNFKKYKFLCRLLLAALQNIQAEAILFLEFKTKERQRKVKNIFS